MHTKSLKTPSLTIDDCVFSQFLSGSQESLINVETLNLWRLERNPNTNDNKGNLVRLGTDNGANIAITSSTFSHMRFCKGLIVYRKAASFNFPGLLNF